MSDTRPKAYSYVRFSTPEQERGDSFRRQVEKAELYAAKHGLDLVEDGQFFDRGVSGYYGDNAATGALSAFRRAVEDGEVPTGSILLIENLDRFSRQQAWRATASLAEIVKLGVSIVSLQDERVYSEATLDEDPHAMLLLTVGFMRAHDESRTKSLRVREAWGKKKEAAAADKKPMTKRLPAWLTLNADRTAIVPIPDRVAVVRRIFREAVKGAGQHRIADMLNREGVPTFGDGSRRASMWHRSYVKKLLENPAVVGTFTPHSTRRVAGKRVRDALSPIPDYFPRIVQPRDFLRVNGSRTATPAPRMRATNGDVSNVLASLAKCPVCGATMTRVNKGRSNGTPYLVCTKAKAGAGCEYRQVRLDVVEEAVRGASGVFIRDMPASDEGLEDSRQRLAANHDALTASIDYLVQEIETGNASRAIRDRLSEQEALLATLETEQEALERQIARKDGKAVERRLERLAETLDAPESTVTALNTALRETFRECVVDYRAGTLNFLWMHSDTATPVIYAMPDE